MLPPLGLSISTARLRLRPFTVGDAERVVEIQSNWNVILMLRLATYPGYALLDALMAREP